MLLRLLMLLVTAVLLHTSTAFAQSASPDANAASQSQGSAATPPSFSGPKGTVAESLKSWVGQFETFRNGLIASATSLSQAIRPETDKVAYGLALITLTLAGIQFAATNNPTTAWTDIFEAFMLLGIFAAIYVGYDQFAPGIYDWFRMLADKIAGTRSSNPALTLISVGAGFLDSYNQAMDAASGLSKLGVALSGLILIFTFVVCAIAALLYSFFIALGEVQAAVGIVVGPLAVALAFSDYSRRFFVSWLDFMIGASMYTVVASVMARLVSSAFTSTIVDQPEIGTTSLAGAAYALGVAMFMLLVALEIPKMAGAIFGSGGGLSGGAVGRLGMKAAGGLGGFLAKKGK
ncbi:conjugal transfer protein (plasmid) [Cupriavidus oxalaticus]|uniref:Conjugal transfer protein n=2 Tax=Burkholderiaceae TaxID=119060 RepID=A0A5P3VR72_9BURK|nr:conjugal transfer protein [Cupriavidus oxalaticus]